MKTLTRFHGWLVCQLVEPDWEEKVLGFRAIKSLKGQACNFWPLLEKLENRSHHQVGASGPLNPKSDPTSWWHFSLLLSSFSYFRYLYCHWVPWLDKIQRFSYSKLFTFLKLRKLVQFFPRGEGGISTLGLSEEILTSLSVFTLKKTSSCRFLLTRQNTEWIAYLKFERLQEMVCYPKIQTDRWTNRGSQTDWGSQLASYLAHAADSRTDRQNRQAVG